MDSKKVLNKNLYDIYSTMEFSTRSSMLERAETVYKEMEKNNIKNNVDWNYSKKSTPTNQVKETNRIKKIKSALEQRSALLLKKKSLKKWEDEIFVELIDVVPENDSTVGRPKKRLSEQNISTRTENKILDPIVKEVEKVARTEGLKMNSF